MGTYLNPGNNSFARILNKPYVDKTGLLSLINQTIDTPESLTCISRPRRFGKSYAAQMLCAYYDKTCDSSVLFEELKIAKDASFSTYLNRYDVLYLDMTGIISDAAGENIVSFIRRKVSEELQESYPSLSANDSFSSMLINTVEYTGNKFVAIIDEWDAPIREAKNPQDQRIYLEFLRSLFKNSGTTARIFAAAYMTGILPIKKDGSQSAISDFREYTMLFPWKFAPYVGFTEEEVRKLCADNDVSFENMKQWYDGYSFPEVGSVYNPNSVMKAVQYHRFASYWTQTSAAESLMKYINMDMDGLQKDITDLIAGTPLHVETDDFANDLTTFHGKDDVLTLLIHLGYLAYDIDTHTVHIPNEEIRREFSRAIRKIDRSETVHRLRESDQLLEDILSLHEEQVGAQIEKIHEEEPKLFYNTEQSLRAVVKRALFTANDHYLSFEEFPAGSGCVDIAYLPRKVSPYPILVIELKWNLSADGALAQIKNRQYPAAFEHYGSDILLVGINYNKDAKPGERHHTCRIERIPASELY